MSVAERFKSAKIADLPIQPSAAYFLAAPSVPDEARQVAVEKAEAGEEITVATAREVVAEAKKKRRPRRRKPVSADKLGLRLIKTLRRYQERWPGDPSELARHLREFADALEKPPSGRKKTRTDARKRADMPILFPDFLRPKLDRPNPKGGTDWDALTRLVDLYDQSPPNWVTQKKVSQIARLRKLDKFEPALTYYLFAALTQATNSFADTGPVSELLANAFPADVASVVAQRAARYGVAGLEFEGQIAPNRALRDTVKRQVPACPVAYNRTIAAERKRVRFESATRLDCFIGDRLALGKDSRRAPGTFGLGVEAKFTSDIDDEATYSPHRNQIARIVEVGPRTTHSPPSYAI
jgi:hypothetical protein